MVGTLPKGSGRGLFKRVVQSSGPRVCIDLLGGDTVVRNGSHPEEVIKAGTSIWLLGGGTLRSGTSPA